MTRQRFDAVLFDLDGVLTDTARVHAKSWKQMFDAFLQKRAEAGGEPFRPFEIDTDYRRYVDGRRRFDGIREFLRSRAIHLPDGAPDDPPDRETVCGLGNRKNEMVTAALREEGVEVFQGSLRWVRTLREQGIRTAVVSASSNCAAVLEAAKIADLFDARVDGKVVARLELRGKPAPDSYLEAARQLGVEPGRAVVVEDAISGVEAGHAGGFGLVVGVARERNADDLLAHGADVAVEDLAEMLP